MSNPLLAKPPRRVIRVETPNRPDLKLYVRAVTGAEFLSIGERVNKAGGAIDYTALQLELYVSDENGEALLAPGEGSEFIKVIESTDMRRLISAGDKLNNLNDETLEQAEKN